MCHGKERFLSYCRQVDKKIVTHCIAEGQVITPSFLSLREKAFLINYSINSIKFDIKS